MSTSQSSTKTAALVLAACLIVSVLVSVRYMIQSSDTESRLNDEKLRTETLLSEKLQLQKEMDKFKSEIKSYKGKNAELDKVLAETSAKLKEKENQLNQIKRENGSIKDLNKQIADLKVLKNGFDKQIADLNKEIATLLNENGSLKRDMINANASIAQLERDNQRLADNIGLLTAMSEDNLILVTKKNEKLTVNSKRARKINFIFDVPQSSLGSVDFKVVSPDSKVFSKLDGSITHHILSGDGNPVASIGKTGNFELVQKVEMVFQPKEELKKGIYKIEVINNGTLLGSMQVKLR